MNRSIGYEIKLLDNLLEREIILFSKKNNCNIVSQVQAKIILFLNINKDRIIFQKDIENIFKLRRSTASGILKTMEKNNLIYKKGTSHDGRLKEVKLTEEAFSKINKIKKQFIELEAKLQKDISSEEIELFFNVINKIKMNIKEEK